MHTREQGSLSAASRFDTLLQRGGYRVWLVLGYLFVAALCGAGIWSEYRQIDRSVEALAHERGSVLFRLIELTRDWNAQHGGVYAPVTEKTQPNPYLKHPRRDLVTTDGQHLTMINPAFMTRQIAEIAEKADGVKYHITSLNPIRPANVADDWEADALKRFEAGEKETLALLEVDGRPIHRFMAPLLVKEACLQCHRAQGYKLGDIRGGISVSMPADKLLSIRDQRRQSALINFGVAGLLIMLLMHVVVLRSRQYVQRLQHLSAEQERLIEQRTKALWQANDLLQDEVVERKKREADIVESEARYRSVLEVSQNGILILQAPDFSIVFANEQVAAMIGLYPAALLHHRLLDYVDPRDRDWVAERQARRLRGEQVSPSTRVRFCQPDGSHPRVAEVHVARIRSAMETPQWVVHVEDVTDRLASQRALQISAAVMENAAEGIIVTDVNNRILQVNPAFTAITGYRPQEVIGRDPGILGSGHHGAEFFEELWGTLEKEGHWAGEMWNRRPDGTVYVVWLAITAIQGDVAETGGRHVATFIDITQRKEVEDLLRHRAQSDPLTDLPNRNLFYDRLLVAMTQARRYGELFGLLYIDLDHFKGVNDTKGHAVGDEVLVETGRRLILAVRESDTVARLGGDEFAVILPKVAGRAEVEEVAARIVASMARPFKLSVGEICLSASVGGALYPEDGDDLDKIRARADAALYAVKERGRNAYQLHCE